jgi:hypothetical protein
MHFEQLLLKFMPSRPRSINIRGTNLIKKSKFKQPDQREKLSMATDVFQHAVRKEIEYYNAT